MQGKLLEIGRWRFLRFGLGFLDAMQMPLHLAGHGDDQSVANVELSLGHGVSREREHAHGDCARDGWAAKRKRFNDRQNPALVVEVNEIQGKADAGGRNLRAREDPEPGSSPRLQASQTLFLATGECFHGLHARGHKSRTGLVVNAILFCT